MGMPAGLFCCTCYVPGHLLNAGRHRITVLVVQDTSSVIYQHQNAVSFDIVDLSERDESHFGKEPGVVAPVSGGAPSSSASSPGPATWRRSWPPEPPAA
jgi:hypothetical protein